MDDRFEGKVAVISGSSGGIGQAIADRLAKEGADVVVNYLNHPEVAQAAVDKIHAAGGKAVMVQADISKVADCQKLIDAAYTELGRCDILVNNAGVEKSSDFCDVTEEDYDFVMDVNVKGVFFLSQHFVRRLREAKSPGRIVNISSVHEDMVFPHFQSYCAAKGALRMLMRDLAVELGPENITVNNVAPGAIDTPINAKMMANPKELNGLLANIPLGRMGKPEEVAGLVAFLASDEGAYVTGSTFIIDGGLIRNYHEQ